MNYLTTIHPLFARVCAATRQYAAAIPVIENPITEIDTTLSDLHYNDNLVYHYSAGVVFAALRRWTEAEDCFDIVVGNPAHMPSAIQLEALKKLSLVQLILYGKVCCSIPSVQARTEILCTKMKKRSRYMSQSLASIFMKSPYGSFANDYPLQTKKMEVLIEKEAQFFESVRSLRV